MRYECANFAPGCSRQTETLEIGDVWPELGMVRIRTSFSGMFNTPAITNLNPGAASVEAGNPAADVLVGEHDSSDCSSEWYAQREELGEAFPWVAAIMAHCQRWVRHGIWLGPRDVFQAAWKLHQDLGGDLTVLGGIGSPGEHSISIRRLVLVDQGGYIVDTIESGLPSICDGTRFVVASCVAGLGVSDYGRRFHGASMSEIIWEFGRHLPMVLGVPKDLWTPEDILSGEKFHQPVLSTDQTPESLGFRGLYGWPESIEECVSKEREVSLNKINDYLSKLNIDPEKFEGFKNGQGNARLCQALAAWKLLTANQWRGYDTGRQLALGQYISTGYDNIVNKRELASPY